MHTNVWPIGSAVLTLIGYKQTYRQTNIPTNKPKSINVDLIFITKKMYIFYPPPPPLSVS